MEEIREMFEKLGIDYSLWIHGIDKGDFENRESIARSIMETGLNIPGNYSSILSTAVSAGRIGYEAYQSDVSDYRLGYGEACNVVVAAPIFIENSSGDKIYLGSPDKNMHNTGQTREALTVLDAICGRLRQIPPEFIYGYYDEVTGQITPNDKHYSKLHLEERDSLFAKLQEGLNRAGFMANDVNEAMVSGNKDFFEKAITYAQKMNVEISQMISLASKKFDEHSAMISATREQQKEHSDRTEEPAEEVTQEETLNADITVIEQQEALGGRVDQYRKTIPTGLFATRRALEKGKQEMMEALEDFSLDDISNISSVNAYKIEKVAALQKRLPEEFKADRLLEARLGQKLEERMQFKGRRIITAKEVEERRDIFSSFDTTVAAFVFEGGRDVVTRFRPLIQQMNRAGMTVNLGRTILGAGDKIVERMAEIERTEGRGSAAWKLLIDPVLRMYDISKDLGGEKWNQQEYEAFEDKLVSLGLIEIAKDDKQQETRIGVVRKDSRPDRADSQAKVQLRQGILREAEIQYVNTGMTPIGFKLDNEGNVVEETQIERMRRETIQQQNMARERAKYEQRIQERQQVQIGINGQPSYNEAKAQQAQQQIQQQQREQNRKRQGMEIE